MKITSIERNTLTMLSTEVEAALKDLGDKYGIDLRYNGGNYGGSTGMIKVNLSVRDTGTGQSGDQAMFNAYASFVGISKEAFGKNFTYKGDTFKITGLRPNAPTYPIRAERIRDGKTYCFPVSVAAKAI